MVTRITPLPRAFRHHQTVTCPSTQEKEAEMSSYPRPRDDATRGLQVQIRAQMEAAKQLLQRLLTAAPAAPEAYYRPVFVQRLAR